MQSLLHTRFAEHQLVQSVKQVKEVGSPGVAGHKQTRDRQELVPAGGPEAVQQMQSPSCTQRVITSLPHSVCTCGC